MFPYNNINIIIKFRNCFLTKLNSIIYIKDKKYIDILYIYIMHPRELILTYYYELIITYF